MARVGEARLLCAYSARGGIRVKESRDGGRTWGDERRVGEEEGSSLTNAELLVLRNGEVWCLYNCRPREGAGSRFAVGFFRSRDGGETWGEAEVLYEAGREFENGCWEPAGLELPDGGIQVYFANEGPYTKSNEQEITLLRSRNGGRMWDKPETVSFRAGSRDGMPVPALLPEVKGIAVAIEDNGLRGTFKPVILGTSWVGGGWRDDVVDGDHRGRWPALAVRLPAETYAGAPYLRWVRKGVTVISFQLAESGDMNDARMAVCLGNGRAEDFGESSFPFPEGRRQLWNSLLVKDESTITAVSEATVDGVRGIWAIDGEIKP